MGITSDSKPPKRRIGCYPRVSLKILLLLCCVFGVVIGYWGRRVIQQRRGVAEFRNLQAEKLADGIYYDYQIGRNYRLAADNSPPYPNWVIGILGIDSLCTIEVVTVIVGKNSRGDVRLIVKTVGGLSG